MCIKIYIFIRTTKTQQYNVGHGTLSESNIRNSEKRTYIGLLKQLVFATSSAVGVKLLHIHIAYIELVKNCIFK